MQKIYKYKLKISEGVQSLIIDSEFCKVLSADVINGDLCVWIQINCEETLSVRTKSVVYLEVFGTGWEIDPDPKRNFIATAIDRENNLVWHVFQRFF